MRIDVITILPEMFESTMSASMIGIAREKALLELEIHDLREYTHDAHRTTDDYPYGGGPGMVMKPEPIFEAIRAVSGMGEMPPHIVFLSAAGRPYTQATAERLAGLDRFLLVCGRYEGIDERALELADEALSIGDYVLTGGELPAMVVIDSVTRLIPGVLGHQNSTAEESFTSHLLEYPQYTRPAVFEGRAVPEVLLSGNHARIAAWRREQSIRKTARVRPELLDSADLTTEEYEIARQEMQRNGEASD